MTTKEHWDSVYSSKSHDAVSWYLPHLEISLKLIRSAASDPGASIIDVGGGASTLVDDLIAVGYQNLTVLDISASALEVTRSRLGPAAGRVRWIAGDVTATMLPPHSLDVWHDRAVFHFLAASEDRDAYIRNLLHSVRPGGSVIIASFGPEGPLRCSGLEVARYDCSALQSVLGPSLQIVETSQEANNTPRGTAQQFMYFHARVV